MVMGAPLSSSALTLTLTEATTELLERSMTVTLPFVVPHATCSAVGCHATDRPAPGRRLCDFIRFSFSDQMRRVRSSPTVANLGLFGCMHSPQTSPMSLPVRGSTAAAWPWMTSLADAAATACVCEMSISKTSEEDVPTARVRPSTVAARARMEGDLPLWNDNVL